MATNVHLTPELENFARACVESGRYNNVSEVVRSALRLLQEQDERRNKFTAMLDAVKQEAEREGVFSLDTLLDDMDEVIGRASP
ncbi:MAG: type II toxin-antitoxin system ParD family antitoxin [Magnetococcales bacterium]|nr:type II toxin-antitoxin system ParD family antitoxin [Magnetococcales bacterium]